jgi:hypothetical protein
MSYEIEKNVPMKQKVERAKFKRKYPFDDMEIGDSFLVATENREKVRVASYIEGIRKHKLFKVTLDEDDNVRCWRLE